MTYQDREASRRLHPIPAFYLLDNYIWVLIQGSDACVVDAGDAPPVLNFLVNTD